MEYNLPIFGACQAFSPSVSTAEIRKCVMDGNRMKVLPWRVWYEFPWEQVRVLLHETAVYVVPTQELIDYLDMEINGEKAIEIGAGSGLIGRALGVVMTDSYQQRDDKRTVMLYKLAGQPVVNYGKDVIKLEASAAVRRIKPHTVFGCYVTHKWRDDTQSGNDKGVDMLDVYNHCHKFILVGHKETHKDNPLMELPHREVALEGLLTRASNQSLNRIFIWEH